MSASGQAINGVSLNQDQTCVCLGTDDGFSVFRLSPLERVCTRLQGESVGVATMLFQTPVVGVVGTGLSPGSSPRQFQVYHSDRRAYLGSRKSFDEVVRALAMNRKRLVVCTENQMHIFDLSRLNLLHSMTTAPNPDGICALSPAADNCFLAYPHTGVGAVMVYDALNRQPVIDINAHSSAIATMAFNATGTLLATASQRGTMVRVFSVPDGEKVHEFRRGSTVATIYHLSFDAATGRFLAAASSNGTIHIFRVPTEEERGAAQRAAADAQQDASAVSSFLGSVISSVTPTALTSLVSTERNFASIKGLDRDVPSTCCVDTSRSIVSVVARDGWLRQYHIDLDVGGECTLLEQFALSDLHAEALEALPLPTATTTTATTTAPTTEPADDDDDNVDVDD